MSDSDLETFRSTYNWDALRIRYFRDLDFLDIAESVPNIGRKREISKTEAESGTYYSIAYFDTHGRLVRLDRTGSGTIPSETYIEYEDNRPVRAVKFRLGIGVFGRRVSESPDVSDEWVYKYNEHCRLVELAWHSFPSLNFRYGYHYNESFTYRYFEYDEKGLLRVYQQHKGLSVEGTPFSYGKVIIYDRLRHQLLTKHTVSKTARVPVTGKGKGRIPFVFGGSFTRLGVELPTCQRCGQPLTFICEVRLSAPLKNQSQLSVIPVFYCFDCLEGITTNRFRASAASQELALRDYSTFPELHLELGRATDPEQEEKALVKLGGLPDWIQSDEHPTCSECGRLMMFVCQINSDDTVVGGSRVLMFGDMGRLYTFACCYTVTSIMQCY